MSPYRRNVMVGAVVLGALITLGWMLIQFGGRLMSPFAPVSIQVQLVADRADGISSGSAVLYRGVAVGRVEKVLRSQDQLQVLIQASVDKEPPLPANVTALIRPQGLVGGSSAVVLELADKTPQGTMQPGQVITAEMAGLEMLPSEFTDLATELRHTLKIFRESNLIPHFDEQVTNVGKLMQSVQTLVDDQDMRQDLKASIRNIRTTAEKADRLTGDLAELSRQVSGRLEQTSRLLDEFQSIAQKINKGQGTAGAIVNDPRLYESLVDTAKQLNATVLDLRRLLEQWEQEGVSLKVK